MIEEIGKSIIKGHSVKINPLRSRDYVVTHEMGHMLENSLMEKKN